MSYTKPLALIFAVLISSAAMAQDDLFDLMDDESSDESVYTPFQATRLINMQSTEGIPVGSWSFIIAHRFGAVNTGFNQFYGLDISSIRLGFEFGLADWLTVGVGRSSFHKTYDGFVKASILKQDKKGSPINLSYYTTIAANGIEYPDSAVEGDFVNRLSYVHQLLISRRFKERLFFQLAPTIVHKNLVPARTDNNDIFSVGIGSKYKLNETYYLTGEYHYVTNPNVDPVTSQEFKNSLSLGMDVVTGGGHVFSWHITNSALAMFERGYITETLGSWEDGDIHFGFNVNREFFLFDPSKSRKKKSDSEVSTSKWR